MSLDRSATETLDRGAPSTPRWTALSVVYWIAFMGALAPGNIQNGLNAGIVPNWTHEAVRLVAAGLLGGSVTPLLLKMARGLPVGGEARWRFLAARALAIAGLAGGLVLVSCVLAAWIFEGRAAPTWQEIAGQMRADLLLLIFCLSLLMGAIHLFDRQQGTRDVREDWPDRLTVGERGRLVVVELDSVDWIESQGNYQAFHVGGTVHLLRATSRDLGARLDPARFVRIHRRFVVAVDRIREVEPLANGDAIVRLVNGVELRQSRQHRSALRERLVSV
jgi:hypothetical protein